MRKEKSERLKAEIKLLEEKLEEIESEIERVEGDIEEEKGLRYWVRIIYAVKIIEKVDLLYSFNEQSLREILKEKRKDLKKPSE